MNYNKILFGTLVCLLLIVAHASAIGVSPGSVVLDKMVRGGYGEKTLSISNPGNEDLSMKIEATGEIASWVTFEPDDAKLVLPRKSAIPIKVKISVPKTVQNGQYTGDVVISTLYEGGEGMGGSGARFMPGLIVRIKLSVTGEEIMGYEVKSVSVKDTEQNYPVEFVVNVENTGNVIVTPKLHVDILDSDQRELGKTLDYAESQVLPTITKQFTIKMPTKGMDTGAYYATITSDLGDEQTLFFQILAPGTLAMSGSLGQISLNKIWVKPQETVKVEATFSNEGELFIDDAKLKCEAYLVDPTYGTKELVTVFEGDSMSVPLNDEVVLTAYFTPTKPGRYSVEGIVVYSGKRTDVKSSILNVLEEAKSYTLYYILIGGIVIVIVFYFTRISDDGRTRRFKRIWGDYLDIK